MQKTLSFSRTKSIVQDKIDTSVPVRINIERMSKALASESIKVPSGLSREETRQFILTHAK